MNNETSRHEGGSLLIIGAGPGGYQAAAYAAKNGLTVTIIEEEHAGGTCLNCGCIPTKALCHDAENPTDFSTAMARKDAIVSQLRSGVERLMQMPGIRFVRGHGSLQADGSVKVQSSDDEEIIKADNIILATGSRAKLPPIPGIDLPGVVTSTELLTIDHVPERLCIVGAGVIGLELAGVFAAYGSKVTVIEFMKECLPQMDSDIAKRLRKQLEKCGITFYMGAGVKVIRNVENKEIRNVENKEIRNVEISNSLNFTFSHSLSVSFDQKGKELSVEADVVLIATGRKPNTEGLNLEAAGIATDSRGFIQVDDNYVVEKLNNEEIKNSSNLSFFNSPKVYAIGDVNGRQMLAHAAEAQAHRVVNHILERKDGLRLDIMPAAVFTTPEVACVGPTEEQLKAENRGFIVHKATFRANGRALCIGETEGLVKLITDTDDRLLAAHIMGPHAADLVQEVTAYITLGATLQQLRETVHIHPTLSEVLIEVN